MERMSKGTEAEKCHRRLKVSVRVRVSAQSGVTTTPGS